MSDLPVNDRIKQLRIENGKTQKEFADELNITQGNLSLIESGKTVVSLETLKRIHDEYQVTYDWLIDGNPNLKKSSSLIPLIDKSAMAGYPANHGKDDYENALSVYRIPGFDKGEHRIFEVEGESMTPTLLPHDYVVTTKVVDFEKMVDGSLAIVITDDEVLAKRVHITNGSIMLTSDNINYQPVTYSIEEIQEIWGIQAKITQALQSSSRTVQQFDEMQRQVLSLQKEIEAIKARFDNK